MYNCSYIHLNVYTYNHIHNYTLIHIYNMKKLEARYVKAQNRDIFNNSDLVVQTGWMQLVGTVRVFKRNPDNETRRKNYLTSKTDPHFFAKAKGYRVYISLYSALNPVSQDEVLAHKETIHEYLQEMAEFYVTNMSEGDKRRYADSE